MNRRLTKTSIQRRSGAAAVEFALVAPLFLVFLFGTIELGRLALARNVIANSSREAARLAIIEGAQASDVIATAQYYASVGSVDNVTATMTESDSTVTVTVSIPFREVSWLPGPWFLKDQTLSATTTMRKETIEVTTTGNGT